MQGVAAAAPGSTDIKAVCREAFTVVDAGRTGKLDLEGFKATLRRVFTRLSSLVPQPDDAWFAQVFQNYAAKTGGVATLQVVEDVTLQYCAHHQRKRAAAAAAAAPAQQSASAQAQLPKDTGSPSHAAQSAARAAVAAAAPPPGGYGGSAAASVPPGHAASAQGGYVPFGYGGAPVNYAQAGGSSPTGPSASGSRPADGGASAGGYGGYGLAGQSQPAQQLPRGAAGGPIPPQAAQQGGSSPTRESKGRAVELASVVMFPLNKGKGEVYENYTFDKALGEGSFGQVALVTHKVTGQRRACKRVGVQSDMDWRLVDNEVRLLKELDHPNIMRLSESFLDGGHIFLIFELCEGGTLLDGFSRHGSEVAAARALQQILSAAAYCHARGVIHRDLKPDNVLYATKAPDSPVKVIDFGLADFLQKLRCTGGKPMERAGTLAFMAPEMLVTVGDGSYGEKVDVWAIGCILFLVLTGDHPFWSGRGMTQKELVARICSGQVIQHQNWINAPQAVKHILGQMLTVDQTKRPSAQEALRHHWLSLASAPAGPGAAALGAAGAGAAVVPKSVFDGLKKFQASSKLKRAVWKLLAKEADESRVQKLRDQFRALDKHQDGFLTRDELLRGMQQHPEFQNLTASDLAQILPPGSGDRISCTDFTAALLARQGFGRAELLNAFRRFDVRKEGKISLEALSQVLKNAGPASKLEAFREADVGQDGAIDFEEFCALFEC